MRELARCIILGALWERVRAPFQTRTEFARTWQGTAHYITLGVSAPCG